MKKLLTVFLAAVIVVAGCMSLTACSGGKKVKVYSQYDLTAESYAFAVAKGNSEILNAANELLADLKSSGELSSIINSFSSP